MSPKGVSLSARAASANCARNITSSLIMKNPNNISGRGMAKKETKPNAMSQLRLDMHMRRSQNLHRKKRDVEHEEVDENEEDEEEQEYLYDRIPVPTLTQHSHHGSYQQTKAFHERLKSTAKYIMERDAAKKLKKMKDELQKQMTEEIDERMQNIAPEIERDFNFNGLVPEKKTKKRSRKRKHRAPGRKHRLLLDSRRGTRRRKLKKNPITRLRTLSKLKTMPGSISILRRFRLKKRAQNLFCDVQARLSRRYLVIRVNNNKSRIVRVNSKKDRIECDKLQIVEKRLRRRRGPPTVNTSPIIHMPEQESQMPKKRANTSILQQLACSSIRFSFDPQSDKKHLRSDLPAFNTVPNNYVPNLEADKHKKRARISSRQQWSLRKHSLEALDPLDAYYHDPSDVYEERMMKAKRLAKRYMEDEMDSTLEDSDMQEIDDQNGTNDRSMTDADHDSIWYLPSVNEQEKTTDTPREQLMHTPVPRRDSPSPSSVDDESSDDEMQLARPTSSVGGSMKKKDETLQAELPAKRSTPDDTESGHLLHTPVRRRGTSRPSAVHEERSDDEMSTQLPHTTIGGRKRKVETIGSQLSAKRSVPSDHRDAHAALDECLDSIGPYVASDFKANLYKYLANSVVDHGAKCPTDLTHFLKK